MIMGVVSESADSPSGAGTIRTSRIKRQKFRDEQVFKRQAKRDAQLLAEISDALYVHAERGGTAIGFSRVLQRIARSHGHALPQQALPRAVREDLGWDRGTYHR